jgi:cysteine desulfurase
VRPPIYLDFHATTPLDERVLDAMLPFLRGAFGNPASAHEPGRFAAQAVERARTQVARLVGAEPREVIFTSGATEAINLALQGLVEAAPARRQRIVSVATEHPAVIATLAALAARGAEVALASVRDDGSFDHDALAELIDDRTAAVCD